MTINYSLSLLALCGILAGEAAALDVDAARDELMNGVTGTKLHVGQRNGDGTWSAWRRGGRRVAVYGDSAFATIQILSKSFANAGAAGTFGEMPIFAAAGWDNGRITLAGDEVWGDLEAMTNSPAGSTGVAVGNALAWVAATGSKSIDVVTDLATNKDWLEAEGYTNVTFDEQWHNHAETADLMVVFLTRRDDGSNDSADNITPAKQAAVLRMMARGKGIYAAAKAEGDLDTPFNEFLSGAGIGIESGPGGNIWVYAPLTMKKLPPGGDNFKNLQLILGNRGAYSGTQITAMEKQVATMTGVFSPDSVVMGNFMPDLQPHLDAQPIPTRENPVTDKLDRIMLRFESEQLKVRPQSEIVAHQSAIPIPGSEPVLTNEAYTLKITSPGRPVYTPYYLKPGDEIVITAPDSWLPQGGETEGPVTLKISHLNDTAKLHSSYWFFPGQTRSASFTAATGNTLRLKTPFGGIVYFKLDGNRPDLDGSQITIGNVVKMPYFKLGETTDAEWNAGGRQHQTPFGVFEASEVVGISHTDGLKNETQPERSLTLLNNALVDQKDYYGRGASTFWVTMVQNGYSPSGVSGSSLPWPLGTEMLDYRRMITRFFNLLIHENGHNLDSNAILLPNGSEYSANMAGVLLREKYGFRTGKTWAPGWQAALFKAGMADDTEEDNIWTSGSHANIGERMTAFQVFGAEFGAVRLRNVNNMLTQRRGEDSSRFDSKQKKINERVLAMSDEIGADATPMLDAFWVRADAATRSAVAAAHPKQWGGVEVVPMILVTGEDEPITFRPPTMNYSFVGDHSLEFLGFFPPAHGTVSQNNDGSFNYTPDAGHMGLDIVRYQQLDSVGYTHTFDITVSVQPIATVPRMNAGIVAASTNWQTVTLDQDYGTDMVVVAVPVWTSGDDPVCTRIRNASGDSFEIMVQHTDWRTNTLSNVMVSYVVNKVGVWNKEEHGFAMEVVKLDSTVTDSNGNWIGQDYTFRNHTENHYDWVGVFGQVMTANDPDWSVFYATKQDEFGKDFGADDDLRIGKHVGSDSDPTRAAETIGLFTVDQMWGNLQIGGTLVGTGWRDLEANDNRITDLSGMLGSVDGAIVQQNGKMTDSGHLSVIFDAAGGGDPFANSRVTHRRYKNDGVVFSDKWSVTSLGYRAVPQIAGSPVNSSPVAVDDQISVDPGGGVSSHTFDPRANDGDIDGDPLTIIAANDGSLGTVTFTGANVTYTPGAGFDGQDLFSYTINDGRGGTAAATVRVAVDSLPVAVDDSLLTGLDEARTIFPLVNDTDADGDALEVAAVGLAAHGTAGFTSTTVTYTPAVGYSGSDAFTYTVRDEDGNEAVGTVDVRVLPGPVANHQWLLDEGSGIETVERIGGATGILTNGPVWIDGYDGKALHFDGSDDHVTTGTVYTAPQTMTVSAWIKPDSITANEPLVSHSLAYELRIKDDRIEFACVKSSNGRTRYESAPALVAGEWQHVAVTVDSLAKKIRFYRNGILLTTASDTIAPFPRTTGVLLGSDGRGRSDSFLAGGLDDIRIFNRVLSDAEILAVMDDGTRVLSPIDVWREQHWGDAGASEAASGENPDHDSLDNLLEFVFGTDPLRPNVIGDSMQFDGDTLTVRWRRADAAGLTYTVQESTTLEPESWAPATGTTFTVISTEGEFETVEITKPAGWATGGESRMFVRIAVAE